MELKVMTDEDNYDVTESDCPECEEGSILVNSFELICDSCDHVTRKTNTRSGLPDDDDFAEYLSNRGRTESDEYRYANSNAVIMPGGFSEAYEGDGIYGEGMSDEEINDTYRQF